VQEEWRLPSSGKLCLQQEAWQEQGNLRHLAPAIAASTATFTTTTATTATTNHL
jgi:hypothetical protein